MLKDTYFKIIAQTQTEQGVQFDIDMLASHPVYNGHFPGNPVSPGVCNMQMIKECAEEIIGKQTIMDYVKQYRLVEVMSPIKTPKCRIVMNVTEADGRFTISAQCFANDTLTIDFKGECY